MKKILLTTVCLGVASVVCAKELTTEVKAPVKNIVNAKNDGAHVVSFSQSAAVYNSKEGKDVIASLNKKREAGSKELQEKAQGIESRMQTLEKQAKASLLSPEAIMQKQGELAKDYRALERLKTAMEEDFQADQKMEMEKLGRKFAQEAKKIFDEKGAKVLLDAEHPGVLSISPDTDITSEVVKRADAKYVATQKKPAPAVQK